MAGHFEIEGERYDLPTLDTLTLDEERLLYVHSDTVISDFAPIDPSATDDEKLAYVRGLYARVRNPAFKTALGYIAYRRKHPDAEVRVISEAIGKLNANEFDEAFDALLGGDPENPPAQDFQNEPLSKSEPETPTRASDSGSPTENDSARADENPASTGTTESDTSSPGAPPIALVS